MSDEKKELIPGLGAEARALNEAFDQTGVKFHNRAEALAAFKENREIVSEDGKLFARYDGELQPLSSCLLKFGWDNRQHVDGRSLPRTGAGLSRPGIDCKQNYKTTREKLDYIAANGADAWEKLPLSGPVSNELKTQSDWYKLPRAERVRLTALDPDAFSKLAPAPNPRPTGAFIDHDAIARHKATMGKLAR
jgi:hypothetical protein